MSRSWITILSLLLISQLASAKILLIGNNTFLSFDYVQATFTRIVESSGECGSLYAAEPLDACSDLTNTAEKGSKHRFAYVLIIRGGCSFEEKVRNAQKAGFKAAIVYTDGYDELLWQETHLECIYMACLLQEHLEKYLKGMQVKPGWGFGSSPDWGLHRGQSWLSLSYLYSAYLLFLPLISLSVGIELDVDMCGLYLSGGRGTSGMPRNLIQRIPTEVFSGLLKVGSTSITCTICIDDYCIGDKLRILPCQHKFHAACIDSWLRLWRSFCPVCKRDAKAGNSDPPTSERTSLLSPSLSSSTSVQSLAIAIRQEPLLRSTVLQPYTVPTCHTQDLRNVFPKINIQNKPGPCITMLD
ncbi:unnamed protein product [Arabis nemorensis]|uniref:RING-type domain-containing protein n=1 Tax=Arabis nemorensis TaxID=586526 RepID=A0A565CDG4_9BRAS|nr:unnamed protein product [Arabis nemorensis]